MQTKHLELGDKIAIGSGVALFASFFVPITSFMGRSISLSNLAARPEVALLYWIPVIGVGLTVYALLLYSYSVPLPRALRVLYFIPIIALAALWAELNNQTQGYGGGLANLEGLAALLLMSGIIGSTIAGFVCFKTPSTSSEDE